MVVDHSEHIAPTLILSQSWFGGKQAMLWAYGAVGITLDSRRCDQGSIPGRADKYDIHLSIEYMIKYP